MTESFGVLKRDSIAEEIRQLDQPARSQLRKYGVRFGAFNIYLPLLLKPGPAESALVLWSLKNAGGAGLSMDALPEPPRAGLTSAVANAAIPEAYDPRANGYHLCGPRAIRMDILERLADLIRPPARLAGHRGELDAAPRLQRRRRLHGHAGDDVDPRLLFGRARQCPEGARLPPRSSSGARGRAMPPPAVPATATTEAPATATAESGATTAAAEVEVAAVADTATAPALADAIEASAAPETQSDANAATASVEPSTAAGHLETEPATPATNAAIEPAPAAEASPASAEAEAEVRMIDIWRPRRRDREHRRGKPGEGRDQQRGRQGEQQDRRQGRGRDRDGGRGRDRRHQGGQPTGQPAEAGAQPVSDAAAAPAGDVGAPPQRQERQERRDDRRPRDGRPFHKGGQREGQKGGPPGGGQQDRRDRDRDRDDRRRREERPRFESRSAGPSRKGGVDPDSPFAALGALKSQLEKQSKERS